MNEGELSLAKAKLVRNFRLAGLAKAEGLHDHIRLLPFSKKDFTPLGLVEMTKQEVRGGGLGGGGQRGAAGGED